MQNALLEHSAILLTCIKRYSVLKSNFGLLFEWPLKTGFTVLLTFTNSITHELKLFPKYVHIWETMCWNVHLPYGPCLEKTCLWGWQLCKIQNQSVVVQKLTRTLHVASQAIIKHSSGPYSSLVASLTADPGIVSLIPAQSHTFCGDWSWNDFYLHSPPFPDSRKVVSYKQKYVHEVLVSHLVMLAQEKSVVRWTWRWLLTGT